jgi:hypothetical protein
MAVRARQSDTRTGKVASLQLAPLDADLEVGGGRVPAPRQFGIVADDIQGWGSMLVVFTASREFDFHAATWGRRRIDRKDFL